MYSFCGCSNTYGIGVEPDEAYPSLLKGTNYAQPGASNAYIFYQALTALEDNNDTIFVQWSSPGRCWFHLSDKFRFYTRKGSTPPIAAIPASTLDLFITVYKLLDADFNQYHYLNKHIKILNSLAAKLRKQIFYINGHLHIDALFFDNTIPSDLSTIAQGTKTVIDFDNLTDVDIIEMIKKIQHYFSVTSIKQWVDIDRIERVDVGSDNLHPGPKSHRLLADKIVNFLKEIKNE